MKVIIPDTNMCSLVQSSPVQSRQLWHFENQRQYTPHKQIRHLQFMYTTWQACTTELTVFFFLHGSIRGCKQTRCVQASVMVVDSIAVVWLVSDLKALMALLEVINTVADSLQGHVGWFDKKISSFMIEKSSNSWKKHYKLPLKGKD